MPSVKQFCTLFFTKNDQTYQKSHTMGILLLTSSNFCEIFSDTLQITQTIQIPNFSSEFFNADGDDIQFNEGPFKYQMEYSKVCQFKENH